MLRKAARLLVGRRRRALQRVCKRIASANQHGPVGSPPQPGVRNTRSCIVMAMPPLSCGQGGGEVHGGGPQAQVHAAGAATLEVAEQSAACVPWLQTCKKTGLQQPCNASNRLPNPPRGPHLEELGSVQLRAADADVQPGAVLPRPAAGLHLLGCVLCRVGGQGEGKMRRKKGTKHKEEEWLQRESAVQRMPHAGLACAAPPLHTCATSSH